MDVLLTANQPLGRYYMVLSPYFGGKADDFDQSRASAIVQYNGNYTSPSKPVYPSYLPGFYDIGPATYFITNLRSLVTPEHPVDIPLEVSHRMYVTVALSLLPYPNQSCAGPGGYRLTSALNNISFANPSLDVLEAYYRNICEYYTTEFPDRPPDVYNFTSETLETDNVTISGQRTKVRVLNYNESMEIVFQGTNNLNSGETHPMHLHRTRFYIIRMGAGNFDNEMDP
ncbi:hypothetical protein MLD38_000342 [Melastoma candidum]|uniref:Uncharacterized protein n=1 Tax=Melastoma candidum TaxID=119954 RepID=A0ACB9S9C4_9MYRT|nr:hypothetical protein MLD38_000342 [Melastoma candidum]